MARAFLLTALVCLTACGIAFSPNAKPAPTPERFEDVDNSLLHEDERTEALAVKGPKPAPPPVGISFVVGGTALDAGPLPKPPIPVVQP